jgi:hypothetical protein
MVGKRTLVLQIRTNRTKDTWKQAISTASVDKVAAAQDERKAGSSTSSRLGPPSVLVQGSENEPGAHGPRFQPRFGRPILNFRAKVPPIRTRRKKRNPDSIPDRTNDTDFSHRMTS